MAKLRKPISVEADDSDIKKPYDQDEAGEKSPVPPEDSKAQEETAKETRADEKEAVEKETDAKVANEAEAYKDEKKRKRKKRNLSFDFKGCTDKKKRKIILPIACVCLAIIIFAVWNICDNNSLEKDFYQITSNKVTENVRIVALADLHNKQFGKDNERLVYEVSKLNPDIIALVGDMMMEQQPDKYDVVLSLCKQLEEVAPVYYSLGNHEIDAMLFKGSNIYKDAKAQGIRIMNNETDTIEVNGSKIDIIGLTQNPLEFEEYGKKFFEKAMEADDNFKLLLNHYPEQFKGTLDDYNIDLAIAGHAHGGLVRLPWVGGLYAADQGFLPELYEGYHEIGNSKLVISRGLGKSGLFPRINNTPEITVIDLSWY